MSSPIEETQHDLAFLILQMLLIRFFDGKYYSMKICLYTMKWLVFMSLSENQP